MANITFNDTKKINVKVSGTTPITVKTQAPSTISTSTHDINYIPGYKEAEEERRANEITRQSNETARENYINDLKARVQRGEFKGDKGDKGDDGEKGDTGAGVVTGGTTGQVLAKKSNTDYDTEWVDQTGGSTDHSQLTNLDYASSGHTGFASSSDLNSKVDKVEGKGLSTNDYTTAEQTKLSGIEANANNYSLPIASDSSLGGIKVGNNLSIDANGVLSATGGGGSVSIDNITITENSDEEIQAVAVRETNANAVAKTWVGTTAQYNAIATKDNNTLYYITDDYHSPELLSNKVTSLSGSSTDDEYPSAKCVYDLIGDIESLLGGI